MTCQYCVRWGPSSPSPTGAQPLQFSAYVCCGQMAGWTKMPLGREVGLSPSEGLRPDIVLHAQITCKRFINVNVTFDSAPPLQKGDRAPPQFSAHVYCGQMTGWIKMTLGMEVGLGPGHIVRDVDPAPPPQNFRPMSMVPKRLHGSRCHLVWR